MFSLSSRFKRTLIIGSLLLIAGPLAQLAAADKPAQQPWVESSLPEPIRRQDYTGTLDAQTLQRLTQHGEIIFNAKFTPADGVGRPMATQAIIPTKRKQAARKSFARTAGMDANACSSCHNDPIKGGAGDFTANVFVSEGFNNVDFDTTDPQFSNERNTNHLFGSGLIELLAREMSAELIAQRDAAIQHARQTKVAHTAMLSTKGVSFGTITAHADGVVDVSDIQGVDPDLVIKPFSQKGVMTSLRQFSINALNHHHGIQASERFGTRWTGEDDFDADKITDELTPGDISALVAWQATLTPPLMSSARNKQHTAQLKQGKQSFNKLGCQSCHRPTLALNSLRFIDPGPLDNAGTLRLSDVAEPTVYDLALLPWSTQLKRGADGSYLVPLFGDLKRHRIADQEVSTLGNELLAQRFVDRDVFITAELWGIGDTAPYGHRGDLVTLDEVIRAHGGEARASRDLYVASSNDVRGALIVYLKNMGISQ